jgi:hypothetical protein
MSRCNGTDDCRCTLTQDKFDLQDRNGVFVRCDPNNSNLCGTCGHGVGFHPNAQQAGKFYYDAI